MGGLGAGLSLGGARGAGMAGCLGCGRGRLLAPSSLESCRTCCAPSTSGLLGRGTGRPLYPPSSQPPVSRQKPPCPAQRREEAGDLRGSPPREERGRRGPRCIRRGSRCEPRGLDSRVRSLGRCYPAGGSGPNCRASGRRARLVPGGWRRWGLLEAIRASEEGCWEGGFRDDTWSKGNECSVCDSPAPGELGLRTQNSLPNSRCVCHPPEPSCLAPVPSGSPGSFRPRPPSVQSSSLNFWAPPLGTLTGV